MPAVQLRRRHRNAYLTGARRPRLTLTMHIEVNVDLVAPGPLCTAVY
jgi:hypothetical protein